jgi:hypothetical protein
LLISSLLHEGTPCLLSFLLHDGLDLVASGFLPFLLLFLDPRFRCRLRPYLLLRVREELFRLEVVDEDANR